MTDSAPTPAPAAADLVRRHLRIGWWALFAFATVGVVLETLHGFKLGLYLDAGNDARRLMWTLGHAHGTLLSLVHLAFAATVRALGGGSPLASRCLTGALILMPAGFLLGGVWVHGGDPGLGVLLVPPGALLMLIAVFVTARAASRP